MKKKSPKIHHFYDEVYRQNYYVLKAAKPDAIIDFASKEHNRDLSTPTEYIAAACWCSDGPTYIWIGPTRKDQSSIIAHECAHAAIETIHGKGIPITPDTDEAFCYYLQYLVQ